MAVEIEEVFAFISDEGPGEGIVAFKTPYDRWMPMVGSDMKLVQRLMEVAQEIANASGQTIRICKFSAREQIGEISPAGKQPDKGTPLTNP